MPVFSQRSNDALKGVHPVLVALMREAIKNTPIDFTITEGLRSYARQKELYAQGRTAPGPIVTYSDGLKHLSNHQAKEDGYGHAVDLYPFVTGKVDVNDSMSLKKIAAHIKKIAEQMRIAIVWGGDWKRPYDPPHFQLKK